MPDNRRNQLDKVRDKPPETYDGRTGSMGVSVPAVDKEMVRAALAELTAEKRQIDQIAYTAELIDAKLIVLIDQAMNTIFQQITEDPPKANDPGNQDLVNAAHRRMQTEAMRSLTALAKRLPQGVYQPTVIVEGQRYAIPTDPNEWGIYKGRIHLKWSIQHVLDATPTQGNCLLTKDGVCRMIQKRQSIPGENPSFEEEEEKEVSVYRRPDEDD